MAGQMAACQKAVCQREEFRRGECLKEALEARWWHQHASRWRQRQSRPGAFLRAVFRMAGCQMEALLTEGLRREEGRPGRFQTGEVRMGCRMGAVVERWTRLLASRSMQRQWQLAAHQREARQRVGVQMAPQREECQMAVGQRRLQMEEVQRAFRWEEVGGCSRLPS